MRPSRDANAESSMICGACVGWVVGGGRESFDPWAVLGAGQRCSWGGMDGYAGAGSNRSVV